MSGQPLHQEPVHGERHLAGLRLQLVRLPVLPLLLYVEDAVSPADILLSQTERLSITKSGARRDPDQSFSQVTVRTSFATNRP
ncbi:hypothetical protein ACWF94_26855 [Streptomyces sp. NPDC055078]